MLDADLRGVLDLVGGAAEHLGEGTGRHRAGRAHLALAADLGTRDRGVLLVEAADRRGGQQEPHHALVVGSRHEAGVVVQHRRDDAGRPVRRRRHDPPPGGVLLVDRQRVEGHPVHRGERVAGVLAAQLPREPRRPARHLEAAGEHPLGTAAVVDALLHHLPQVQQALAHLGLGAPRQLVGHHDPADRQPRLRAPLEQLVTGGERVPHRGVVRHDHVLADLVLVEHEPAADRVVVPLPQGRLALGRVGRGPGGEAHAVRVERQRLAAVQHDVGVDDAGDLVGATEAQPAGGSHLLQARVGSARVRGLGGLALQAQHDRLDRAVAVARGAERAEQLGAHPAHLLEQPVGPQALDEGVRGPHRSHGVRAGGADAHGEEVERADGHRRTVCQVARPVGHSRRPPSGAPRRRRRSQQIRSGP